MQSMCQLCEDSVYILHKYAKGNDPVPLPEQWPLHQAHMPRGQRLKLQAVGCSKQTNLNDSRLNMKLQLFRRSQGTQGRDRPAATTPLCARALTSTVHSNLTRLQSSLRIHLYPPALLQLLFGLHGCGSNAVIGVTEFANHQYRACIDVRPACSI